MIREFEEYMSIKHFKDMILNDEIEESVNNLFKIIIGKPLKEINEYISESEEIRKFSMIVVNDNVVNIIIFNGYNRNGNYMAKYITSKIVKEFKCKQTDKKYLFRSFVLNFFDTDEKRPFIEVTD